MNKGDGSVRCCDNGDVGEGTHPKHITPAPTQPESSWETRLRDLYLTTTPDEEGLYTASISFNWGKFTFEPKDKSVCEFYLATKDSIESFLHSEIEAAEARGIDIGGKTQGGTGRFMYEKGRLYVIAEILEKLPNTGELELRAMITHADAELASIQSRSMWLGFQNCRDAVLNLLTSLRNK